MSDLVGREALCRYALNQKDKSITPNDIMKFPSAQPEITDEQAIEHLQESGWMQNHDRQMYEMGLKERLADDGGSYDALLLSAQPEYTEQDVRDSFNEGYRCGMEAAQPEERTEERTETHGVCLDAIDRQTAVKALNTEIIKRRLLDDVNDGMLDEFDTEDILRKLPSVQPEITRCRDCISYQEGIDINGRPFTRCNGSDTSVRTYGHTPPDWYCADAKRRNDG